MASTKEQTMIASGRGDVAVVPSAGGVTFRAEVERKAFEMDLTGTEAIDVAAQFIAASVPALARQGVGPTELQKLISTRVGEATKALVKRITNDGKPN